MSTTNNSASAAQDSLPPPVGELDPYSNATDSHVLMEIGGENGVFAYLATLPERAIISKAGLSKVFGVCDRTITRMVDRGELPPPIRLGGRNMWVAGRLLDWLTDSAKQREEAAARLRKRHQF